VTKILVVDDEKSLRISLREILRDAGHTVEVAEDADEALRMLGEDSYGIVLSDIIMPRISGVALLKAIKDASPDTQVILMTGEPTVETASEAVRAGAFDYLAKPVPARQLITSVANAARIRDLIQERERLTAENFKYQEHLEELVAERTAALRTSEHKYRLLAENASDVIWTMDRNFQLTYVSPAVELVHGYSPQESLVTLKDTMSADSFAGVIEVLTAEMNLAEKSGYPSDRTIALEVELFRKQGEKFWAEIAMRILLDDSSRPTGILGITRDISDRKQTEQFLRHAQRMEAMGQLTSGIAHDFNNILGIILGNLELLQMQNRQNAEMFQRLDVVKSAAHRAVSITDQLLGFSRRQTTEVTVTHLNATIRNLAGMIGQAVTPQTKVEYDFTDDLWATEIDSGDFENALINLTINARDAMPPEGRLTLQTRNCRIPGSRPSPHGVAPGDYVQLVVRDNGSGIAPEVQERMFEPFFTTKPAGKGTGLGLSLVFGFVQRSGGHIHVSSKPSGGTTLTVYLPRATGTNS
jgi:PAS domain S-box-containing protein